MVHLVCTSRTPPSSPKPSTNREGHGTSTSSSSSVSGFFFNCNKFRLLTIKHYFFSKLFFLRLYQKVHFHFSPYPCIFELKLSSAFRFFKNQLNSDCFVKFVLLKRHQSNECSCCETGTWSLASIFLLDRNWPVLA